MGKDVLYKLIDRLNEEERNKAYKYLIQLIPEAEATYDEVQAIKKANEEIRQGKVRKLEDIDWGTD